MQDKIASVRAGAACSGAAPAHVAAVDASCVWLTEWTAAIVVCSASDWARSKDVSVQAGSTGGSIGSRCYCSKAMLVFAQLIVV